jgi:coenzyme Q-binding protein COQ10
MATLSRAGRHCAVQLSHRRSFLPGLSNLLKTAEQRRRTESWQRVVQHPRATIFRVVADVGSYSEFLPWCIGSRVLERTVSADGAGEQLSTEISVGFELLQSSFFSSVTVSPDRGCVHAVSEPNDYMEHLSFTWQFAPVGETACRLDLELDFCLRQSEHVLMWDLAQDKIMSEYVGCFSRRCTELSRRGGDAGP